MKPNHSKIYAGTGDPATYQRLQDSISEDPDMPKGVSGTTVYEVLSAPNADIQRFIVANSREGAGWIPGSSPYVTSNAGVNDSTTSNTTPAAPTARCANGDLSCLSGVGVQQNTPLTVQQQQAVGAYFGRVSNDYQRAAALATATGNVPVTVSFEIAAGVAGLLEQAFMPSAGKVVVDNVVDVAAKEFSTRTGVPLAVVNEIVEREIKPRLQDARNMIDAALRGNP